MTARFWMKPRMDEHDLQTFELDEEDEAPHLLKHRGDPTETIDLNKLFSRDVTESGSFDLRGVESTALGKLLHALPIPALLVNRSRIIIFANRACGTEAADYQNIQGRRFLSVFARPGTGMKAEALVKKIISDRKPLAAKALLRLQGAKLWGRVNLRSLRLGAERSVLVLVEDLTHERKQLVLSRKHKTALKKAHHMLEIRVQERTAELSQANTKLRQEIAERLRMEKSLSLAAKIIESSNEGIMVTDPAGAIVEVNQAFCEITGFSRNEIIGRQPSVFQSDRHSRQFYDAMWKNLKATGRWKGEIWDRRKTGEIFPKLLSVGAVYNEQEHLTHYVCIFSDMTKLKRTEERLQRLAHYDPLTGLPNRLLLRERIEQALIGATDEKPSGVLMFLDLDRFKAINDSMGHPTGDRLIVDVAARLRDCLGKNGTAARLSGDEFALLLPGISDLHVAAKKAEELLKLLSRPFMINRREVFASASIGIAVYPVDGPEVDNLLQHADTALNHAKDRGRNNFQFFSQAMNKKAQERLKLENALRRALKQREFDLFYQPLVDLQSGEMIGSEALLRWRFNGGRPISAERLIPLAEETGLIIPIGQWVLQTACKQIKKWVEMGLPPIRVGVNLSGRQLEQDNIVETVTRSLEEVDLDPDMLNLELTESIVMQDADEAVDKLEAFRKQGIRISVDDFGTGYSSLSYLSRLPIDKVKIDKSFISGVSQDSHEEAIVKAIIAVAHSLGFRVIGEGVETREQLSFLVKNRCDEGQGYLFSRPVPPDSFVRLLSNGSVKSPLTW